MAKPTLVVNNDELTMLTQRAEKLAAECRLLLQRDSKEQRRAHYLEYGQIMLAIRKLIPSDKLFGQYKIEHDLDLHFESATTDAIWMAENWATLQTSVEQKCPYSNPVDVRQWYGEQTGVRNSKKRNAAPAPVKPLKPAPLITADLEEMSAEEMQELLPQEMENFYGSLIFIENELRMFEIFLSKPLKRHDTFKDEMAKIDQTWKRLSNKMSKLKR